MKSILILMCAMAFCYSHPNAISQDINHQKSNKIQLALLLDTSNSMDGLIEQAKAKLWSVVNEMADKKINDKNATIEIALYEYGNHRLSGSRGWIRRVSHFTTQMDDISELLFSLSTNGGSEYCGQVIDRSLLDLEWDPTAAYKVIFIAGNESFAQGPTSYIEVGQAARHRDIVINTIFCGDFNQGIRLLWKDGAKVGAGDYFVINQNAEIQYINTPYDDELSTWNLKLNESYIPYGQLGKKNYNKLMMQDTNANTYGISNLAERTLYKSKSQYNNASWDLLDAYEESETIMEDKDALPAAYQKLSQPEIKLKIEQLMKDRVRIKNEIQAVGKKRAEYIMNQKKKGGKKDLEDSMIEVLNEQMRDRGFDKEDNVGY